jgi:uncharacterized phage protein (TIGR02218 family)
MKTVSNALAAHLDGDCTTLTRLYKITRKDLTVLTYTDHDQDIDTTNYQGPLTDGGYVYEAAVGFSPTAIDSKSDLSVDNQEVTALIDSDTITEKDLRFGVWDGAEVEIRLVNWADLSQGELKLRLGILGTLSMKNGQLTAEILGLTNKLQQVLGRSYGTPCDAELGDSRCKATVPTETGYVNTSSDSHHITPHAGGSPSVSLSGASGYYNDGILTFTSGINSGISYQVGTWDGTTLYLKNPLFAAPSVDDTFTISPGCGHNVTDCRNKFNNIVNYRGFPSIPGQDAILQYPDPTG